MLESNSLTLLLKSYNFGWIELRGFKRVQDMLEAANPNDSTITDVVKERMRGF